MQLKRILLSIAGLLFIGFAQAQFSKGDKMVGATIGSVFFNSGKSDYSYPAPTTGFSSNVKSFGVNFTPMYGWFISDKTVMGASFLLDYGHQKTFDKDGSNGNTFNEDQSNHFNIGIGGFARNYFSTSGGFSPFGQVAINFGISSSSSKGFYFTGSDKSTYDGSSSGGFFANAGLSLGMTKMLNPHTGLDIFLGYNYSYTKNEFKKVTQFDMGNNGTIDQTSTSQPTTKYTNNGVTAGIGLQVFLEGKKK
jgi:hypothetical protein